MRVALIALFAVALAACGKDTIRPEGAEKSVADIVSRETRFQPKDVDCPSGVEAKIGEKFKCRFTGPEGPYTAFMEVRKVDGEKVLFQVVTRPTAAD